MIRYLAVDEPWTCVIAENAISGSCRVGRVIGRGDWGGVTMLWRIELLTGRMVSVSPDLVTALPETRKGDLDIPAAPAGTPCTRVVSPTPAVRARDLDRRAKVFGVSVIDMIEAGFGSPQP